MVKIREIREEKNLTQIQLASMIGVVGHNVGDWERGKCEPSIEMLKKIAGALEVSIDYLVGNSDDFGNITVSNGSAELPQDEQRILSAYRLLSDIEKEKLIDDAEFYAKRYNLEHKTKRA